MNRLAFLLALLAAAPAAAQDVAYSFAATRICLAAAGDDGPAREACIGASAAACMSVGDGFSTVGQGACLDAERADWDARLNADYRRLKAQLADLDSYAPDLPPAAGALRDMQRAWIGFRDAACGYEASLWNGGTGAGPAALACLMRETARQALRLEDGIAMTCGADCP